MRRREFLGALGGAVAVPFARPLAARAQQGERMRRIGVLLPSAADDAEFQARLAAFHQALALLGWTIGRNVRIDTRWATPNAADIRRHAAELAALAPDVILVHGAAAVGAMLQATRTVPIVFPVASDPVGAGFVDSLARPGGNVTGFMSFEYSLAGKRLELLKQIAPGVMRAAVLRDPTQGGGTSEFAVIQTVALEAKRQGLLRELLPQARAIAALVDPNAPDSATRNARTCKTRLARSIGKFKSSKLVPRASLTTALPSLPHSGLTHSVGRSILKALENTNLFAYGFASLFALVTLATAK